MRNLISWLIAMTAFLATPATAQEQEATPEGVAAAEALLDAMDYDDLMARTVDEMVLEQRNQMRALVEQSGEEVSDALLEDATEVLTRHSRGMIMGNLDELRTATAYIYAANLSVDDLNRLTVLQSDPVMKRFNAAMPAMMRDTMALTMNLVMEAQPAMQAELMEVIQRHLEPQSN